MKELTKITDETSIVLSQKFLKIIIGIVATAFSIMCSIFWFLYQDVKSDNNSIQETIIKIKEQELKVISDKVIFIEGQMQIITGMAPTTIEPPSRPNIGPN